MSGGRLLASRSLASAAGSRRYASVSPDLERARTRMRPDYPDRILTKPSGIGRREISREGAAPHDSERPGRSGTNASTLLGARRVGILASVDQVAVRAKIGPRCISHGAERGFGRVGSSRRDARSKRGGCRCLRPHHAAPLRPDADSRCCPACDDQHRRRPLIDMVIGAHRSGLATGSSSARRGAVAHCEIGINSRRRPGPPAAWQLGTLGRGAVIEPSVMHVRP